EGPDAHYDSELTSPVDSAEETKAVAVEDRRADHRLQQVVREGHSSHRRHRAKRPAAPAEQHHQGGPAQPHEENAPIVYQLAYHRVIQDLPLRREAPPEPKRSQQDAGAEPKGPHAQIEGARTRGAEDALLEQPHADRHEARHLPEE